jgi:tetratricopeptide (TPR) repeat protein
MTKVFWQRKISEFEPAVRLGRPTARAARILVCAGVFVALACQSMASGALAEAVFATRAEAEFLRARARFQADTNSDEAAGEFARACFHFADLATNNAQSELVAEQGIGVCRALIARQPDSAPGHYYLGLNLGQLADTRRNFSALKMVKEMEREFLRAVELDERFDYAGPDRTLGMLYLQAPVIGSVGSRSKARQRLKRAVELAPEFPGNRLNLGEAYLKWGEFNAAIQEVKALEESWPQAREKFSGESWAVTWWEWERRLKNAKKRIENASKTIQPPRNAN